MDDQKNNVQYVEYFSQYVEEVLSTISGGGSTYNMWMKFYPQCVEEVLSTICE